MAANEKAVYQKAYPNAPQKEELQEDDILSESSQSGDAESYKMDGPKMFNSATPLQLSEYGTIM